jgi:hypothetical protein
MLTPEEAMKAAREAATPTVEKIIKIIDGQLAKYVGVGSIEVEIPTKLKGRGTANPTEVHPFMLEEATKDYTKPTDSGSYWGVRVNPNNGKRCNQEGEVLEEFYDLLFTPIFPAPPNPADH